MDTVVFPLFGEGGFVNPTPWPEGARQSREFDGGWRWFPRYEGDCTCIYNVKLHKQAYYNLTAEEIENSCLQPELLLTCAKIHVLIDHRYFTAREEVLDKIRADFRKLRQELFGDRLR